MENVLLLICLSYYKQLIVSQARHIEHPNVRGIKCSLHIIESRKCYRLESNKRQRKNNEDKAQKNF